MKVVAMILVAALVHASAADDENDFGRIPLVGLQGPETDACPGIGRIAMFEPRKGDFMRVYSDAGEGAPVKDKIDLSTLVWLCEADEGWQGIVYPSGQFQELGDCRVSTTLPEPEPYNGPCRYGWVEAKYIELTAG